MIRRRDVDALTPAERKILDEFRADLRRAREEETEKLRLAFYLFEIISDGLAELNADVRTGRLQPPDPVTMH
jgi:hypothetical protein